jgi:hypothetical protein
MGLGPLIDLPGLRPVFANKKCAIINFDESQPELYGKIHLELA